ncbi:MAG TPA: hypothetical protein VF092_20840 [Longimicrobium sp.]
MSSKALRRYLAHTPALLGAALVLVSAACSDTAVSPSATSAARAASRLAPTTTGSASRLVSNSVKYHDGSAPHATGRSGSARLEALAVTDAHGITTLTLTTGDLDHLDSAPGEIVKVQLKVFGPDGELISSRNYNQLPRGGTQTFELAGLPADSRIQVQANVRGIDGRRTDVVTLTETVKFGPALDVDVHVPDGALVGAPVVITATVTETNGQVGTRTDCVLYIDGQPVDRADDIWVDAGDAVSCAFTYTFQRTGTYQVEVRAGAGSGGGALLANVGDSELLEVTGAHRAAWTASVEDRSPSTTTVLDYTWTRSDGSHKEYSNTETTTTRAQTITLQGTLESAATFPLAAVGFSVQSSGVRWEEESWTGLASATDANGQECASRMSGQGAMFFLCNGRLGGATYGYTRFAGTVTYHGEGFSNVFDGPTATQSVYSWNDSYGTWASDFQVRPLGTQVTVTLGVSDARGSWTINPTVALSSYSNAVEVTQPRSCETTNPYWLDGGSMTACTTATRTETGWTGTAAG